MAATAFFSSARTSVSLKQETETVLKELGLTWSAFINNAARRLVQEKKIEFSLRDNAGFTQQKSQELLHALQDVDKKTHTPSSYSASEAKNFLTEL